MCKECLCCGFWSDGGGAWEAGGRMSDASQDSVGRYFEITKKRCSLWFRKRKENRYQVPGTRYREAWEEWKERGHTWGIFCGLGKRGTARCSRHHLRGHTGVSSGDRQPAGGTIHLSQLLTLHPGPSSPRSLRPSVCQLDFGQNLFRGCLTSFSLSNPPSF